MKPATVLLLLCLAAPSWAQEGDSLYSIDADEVRVDNDKGVTTYEGNARAEVAGVVVQAETITIVHGDGLPSRLEASGDPLKFRRQASSNSLSGSAEQLIFSVPDLKLTLIEYVVADPEGNTMKGRQASFVLSP